MERSVQDYDIRRRIREIRDCCRLGVLFEGPISRMTALAGCDFSQ